MKRSSVPKYNLWWNRIILGSFWNFFFPKNIVLGVIVTQMTPLSQVLKLPFIFPSTEVAFNNPFKKWQSSPSGMPSPELWLPLKRGQLVQYRPQNAKSRLLRGAYHLKSCMLFSTFSSPSLLNFSRLLGSKLAPGISKAFLATTLLGLIIAVMQKDCAFRSVFLLSSVEYCGRTKQTM